MKSRTIVMLAAAAAVGCAYSEKPKVVSFRDAAKIKTWDAWGDAGKTPTTWTFKERKCVTLAKIRKMSSGLEPAGQLETRPAKAIRSNMWSVGCETMDVSNEPWTKMPTKDFLPCFDACKKCS